MTTGVARHNKRIDLEHLDKCIGKCIDNVVWGRLLRLEGRYGGRGGRLSVHLYVCLFVWLPVCLPVLLPAHLLIKLSSGLPVTLLCCMVPVCMFVFRKVQG